jgi:hypothetical protein
MDMKPEVKTLLKSLKSATSSWYQAKTDYTDQLDAHVNDQLSISDNTAGYNTVLTRMNAGPARTLVTLPECKYRG